MIKIIIVEDEMVIAANLSLQLTNFGYEVTGIIPRGEQVISHIKTAPPDLILLDIHLKGKMDGIEVGQLIVEQFQLPIIYLTSNTDDATFARAKATQPYAFISKPFDNKAIKRAIELAITQIKAKRLDPKATLSATEESPYLLTDRIFVRSKNSMVKLLVQDILYVEAERNYTRIFTKVKEYVLTMTLKTLEVKLPPAHFLRIHRSFMINVSQIDEVHENYVVITNKTIPLSKAHKEELAKRLNLM